MMHSRSRLLFLVVLLAAATLALPWAASAQEPVTSRLKLSIGGYVKPEMLYKTNSGAVAYAGAVPGTQNFGFTSVPQRATPGGSQGEFAAIANESRFNFTLTAPDWRGLKPTAFMEFDFDGDTASTLERWCQTTVSGVTSGPCATTQNAGNPAGAINNGGFRIRHAFFRLAGEGMGGSWNLTFGQTWAAFGLLPYYSGSSLSFGGATIFGTRNPQLSIRHNVKFLRDFAWESTAAVTGDTTNFNEMPGFELSGRLIYSGWQGWMGGARTATNLGVSARVQRQKADLVFATGASTLQTGDGFPSRSLSNTAWGITGGIFLPILPGVSATDRTWALSAVSEGGYGEGVNTLIPGTNPYPAGVALGSNNRADPGAGYFNPGKCNVFVSFFSLASAAGPLNPCGFSGFIPTELSLTKTPWASYNVQFYLPWNFWLSGGQKWIWYTNADNAVAQTCIPGLGLCTTPATGLITPVNQGQWNTANIPAGQALCTGVSGTPPDGSCTSLFSGRDALVKRQTYTYVALFYDMTPNIRWGFEYGRHGTNRKNSGEDNQSHRWQFGAYYFF